MPSVLRSVDSLWASGCDYGPWVRLFQTRGWTGAITNATTTSGYITGGRIPDDITVPSMGSGLSGMYLTQCRMVYLTGGGCVLTLAALEYTLGTLTVSGNSFADGSVMPTKKVRGESVQTATLMPMLYVSAAYTATTPVLTVTYKDQDGVGSNSAALTLPTNAAAGSLFQIAPHMAAGDSAIQDVTNMSISTGSAGTIKCIGVLPLALGSANSNVQGLNNTDPLATPWLPYLCEAGEKIAFYRFGRTSADEGMAVSLVGIPELSS